MKSNDRRPPSGRAIFDGDLCVLRAAVLDDDAKLVLSRVIASIGQSRLLIDKGFEQVLFH